jgi:hypothetical protein
MCGGMVDSNRSRSLSIDASGALSLPIDDKAETISGNSLSIINDVPLPAIRKKFIRWRSFGSRGS